MNVWLSSVLSAHLLDRRGGHRRAVLNAWRAKSAQDFISAAERRAQQARALADLLNHCRAAVPFFRERLAGFGDISPVNAFEIWQQLPIVSRSAIQEKPELFRADGVEAAADDATGGSTGTPMRFWVDRDTQLARESSLMWADSLAGWQPGERVAMLWGADRDVCAATRSLRLALRWRIENRRWFDAFRMGEAEMLRYHRVMQRFRPHYLIAYASALEVFSDFLNEQRLRPRYPLNALISSAEVLQPWVREKVEKTFGRPVFDRYGNREFGALAAECGEHGGLHVNPCDMIVEVLPIDRDEAAGRVVITYLWNRVMPFIRYDTGDLALATEQPCPCGRTTLRLTRIIGRQSDVIRLSDGRRVHGEFFTHMFYGITEVRRFQFVQKSADEFELKVVAPQDVFDRNAPLWRQTLQNTLGAGAQIEIGRVDEIPPLPSGKHRFTISRI